MIWFFIVDLIVGFSTGFIVCAWMLTPTVSDDDTSIGKFAHWRNELDR